MGRRWVYNVRVNKITTKKKHSPVAAQVGVPWGTDVYGSVKEPLQLVHF